MQKAKLLFTMRMICFKTPQTLNICTSVGRISSSCLQTSLFPALHTHCPQNPISGGRYSSSRGAFSQSRLYSTDTRRDFEGDHSNEFTEKTSPFGFQTMGAEKKTERVNQVFSNVATRYDLMNDLMSFGIHRWWKDEFVRRLAPGPGIRMLDVAGGTGDITFRIADYINYQIKNCPNTSVTPLEDLPYHITVCDLTEEMLVEGQRRAVAGGYSKQCIDWIVGNGEMLPFENNSFDAYTIAFGIRNFADVQKGLEEAHRVLKPGGRFVCLEFSQVSNPLLAYLYKAYSFSTIPVMGQVVAGDWDSYQYLVESIHRFPSQDVFKKMIQDTGFSGVSCENFTFGVVSIHSGFKL